LQIASDATGYKTTSRVPITRTTKLYDSDIDKMASDINDFFNSVSGDIPPLDESILKTLDVNDYEDMFIIYPWQVEQKLYFVHIKQLDLTAFQIGSLKKCLRLSPS